MSEWKEEKELRQLLLSGPTAHVVVVQTQIYECGLEFTRELSLLSQVILNALVGK